MCPIFITVGSCPGIATGLITVHDVNPWLDPTILIVIWNASATACITSASAYVSCCDIFAK